MPSRAQSTRSPSSTSTTGPTMLPAFSARTWSSSRSAASVDLEVLDERVGLVLVVERVLVRALHRVLGAVVDLAERRREVRPLQLGQGVGHQHRLHELLRHADVEERARLLALAQLDDAALLVEVDVGEAPHGDRERRVLAALGGRDHESRPRRPASSRPPRTLRLRLRHGVRLPGLPRRSAGGCPGCELALAAPAARAALPRPPSRPAAASSAGAVPVRRRLPPTATRAPRRGAPRLAGGQLRRLPLGPVGGDDDRVGQALRAAVAGPGSRRSASPPVRFSGDLLELVLELLLGQLAALQPARRPRRPPRCRARRCCAGGTRSWPARAAAGTRRAAARTPAARA